MTTHDSRRGGPSLRNRALVAAVTIALAAGAAACTPPTFAPPTLPATVGVQWLRDAGGGPSPDPVPSYLAAFDRYSVLNGAITGPTPVGSLPGIVPATFWSGGSYVRLMPDGTAMFPWNGFAGEAITSTTVNGPTQVDHTVMFPGGSCSFTSYLSHDLRAIVPSPDGTKIAMAFTNHDASMAVPTSVVISELAPGCPLVVSASYPGNSGGVRGGGGDRLGGMAFVWSPDSSAVVYPVQGPSMSDIGRVARLAAGPGESPVTLIDDGPTAQVIPTGWTSGDRLLVSTVTTSAGPPATATSAIEIIIGSTRRVIDTVRVPSSISSLNVFLHYGYFVPGTATVAYSDASATPVNSAGTAMPWYRAWLYDDVTWGKAPLTGVAPPLAWHTDNDVEVPNSELVERFVH